jgi:DNA-binding SARP family transcriptional activator
MDEIRFGLLGPLLALDRSGLRAVGAPKQRTILAALMLRPGQVVPADELVELVWPSGSPANARKTVQSYVMRLRNALGERLGPRVVTRDPGYAIEVSPSELDIAELERAVTAARECAASGDWPAVTRYSQAALALRRGAPLVDVPSDALHRDHVPHLAELLVTAAELSVEAQTQLGNFAQAADLVASLCRRHPLRESLRLRQMQLLDQMHRRAEAIDVYHDLRRVLADEIGIEPGAALQDFYVQLLRGGRDAGATISAGDTLHSLPSPVDTFTGRAEIILRIQDLLSQPQSAPVVLLHGPLGIGKTATAVQAAHRLTALYPDGQIYVDARGSTPSPMTAGEVASQTAPLRDAMAGQRVLMVLDDVADGSQVAGLLAPAPGGGVLLTSRAEIDVEGAVSVRLGRLSAAESLTLAQRLAGPERGPRWTAATHLVAEVADGMPVAILDFASRITRRDMTAVLAALADPGRRLDGALRAYLEQELDRLDEPLRDNALLMSITMDWPVSAGALAAVLGVPTAAARDVLLALARHGWLMPGEADRFDAVEPIRLFLQGIAAHRLPGRISDAAIRRHLAWQVRSAWEAALVLNPQRCPVDDIGDVDEVRGVVAPPDRDAALAWFDREEPHLRAAVERAIGAGLPDAGWKIAVAAWHPAYIRGRLDSALNLLSGGLRCAQATGEALGQLWVHTDLGSVYRLVGQPATAITHLRAAQTFLPRVDRPSSESAIALNLGDALVDVGQPDAAIDAYRQALMSTRHLALRDRECVVLINLANTLRDRDELGEAADHYRAALALAVDNALYRAEALLGLGEIEARTRCYEAAADSLRAALSAYHDAGSPHFAAHAGRRLAEVLALLGHHDEAAAQRAETDLMSRAGS